MYKVTLLPTRIEAPVASDRQAEISSLYKKIIPPSCSFQIVYYLFKGDQGLLKTISVYDK